MHFFFSVIFLGAGLSATYTALLSWLLSLVPHDFSFLGGNKKGESTSNAPNLSTTSAAGGKSFQTSSSTLTQPSTTPDLSIVSTFNVLGLQQTWQDEELKLNVVVTPSDSFLRGVAAGKQGTRSSKGKVSSQTAQHFVMCSEMLIREEKNQEVQRLLWQY